MKGVGATSRTELRSGKKQVQEGEACGRAVNNSAGHCHRSDQLYRSPFVVLLIL